MKKVYTSDDGTMYAFEESPSRKLPPFTWRVRDDSVTIYENEFYDVSYRYYKDRFFVKNSEHVILGITNADQTSRHDWREFQQIKNMICGRDWEGIELYPAESRLVDPSNQFYMWCVPRGILKFGLPGSRRVWDMDESMAPQRPFPRR